MSKILKGRFGNSVTILMVSDLDKSKSYYQNVLGFSVDRSWAISHDFGLVYKLIQANDSKEVRPFESACNTYVYVNSFNILNTLYDDFKDKGACFLKKLNEVEYERGAWKEFSIKDPDGYVIGFDSSFGLDEPNIVHE
ncbi:VOC family protein [Paenibacillus sp. N3/727]|uniref:VOC family protein n=1 Tax=Paenibacillus sp. N3/727 TaxID=2925845 RepID=UPI001F53589B|nr:VOC family protein [Paenibacillus sp. N3/727]UNK20683.1 VOC family protein [Paenibacillus sp. N3/727]